MKKFTLVLSLCMAVSIFTGCGSDSKPVNEPSVASRPTRERKTIDELKNKSSSDNNVSNTPTGEKIILTYAENQKEDYPTTLGAYEFARLVKEGTKDRIIVDVHPNGEFGDENDVVKKVQSGEIALMRVSLAPLANHSPELNVLQLPYLYNDANHMWKVLNGDIGEQFLKNLVDSAKVIGLAWYDSGSRNFYNSVREVKTPEDLVGLKIRVQDTPLAIDMANMLGAEAVAMGYADVMPALENKTIDGAENNWPSYESTGHYKAAKYYTLDEHTRIPEMIIMNADLYNHLSAEDKIIIKESALLSSELQRDEWAKKEKEAETIVKESGCIVTQVTDVAAFQKAVQPLYEKYAGDNLDLINEIQSVN